MAVKLTKEQKDEIRKLTQFANRRIKSAFKAYEEGGKQVVPNELTGFLQTRSEWHTEATPLSRSVVFETKEEYVQHMSALRRFRRSAPTIKQYTTDQQKTTQNALQTALGDSAPKELIERVGGMSAVELSDFWQRFSRHASRLGIAYSSGIAILHVITDFFGEDYSNLEGV